MKASYLNTQNGTFIIITSESSTTAIPVDPANTDYQNIMRLVESNELTIADPE